MREFDSVLKKLAESAEIPSTSADRGSQKQVKGWLGGPFKGSLAADPVGTLQAAGHSQSKEVQGAASEPSAMDYEGFKTQITTSRTSRSRQSAQESQGGKNQTPSPAEMIYFPQTADEPVPIQLAGLKKGASSADMYTTLLT